MQSAIIISAIGFSYGAMLFKRLSSGQKRLYTNGNKTLCGYDDTFVYDNQKGGRIKSGTHGVENVRSNLGGREIYGTASLR